MERTLVVKSVPAPGGQSRLRVEEESLYPENAWVTTDPNSALGLNGSAEPFPLGELRRITISEPL